MKLSYALLSRAMQFLPEERLTITTSLDGSTIKQRFTNIMAPQQLDLLRPHQQQATAYHGNVIGNDLEFFRPVRIAQNRYAPFVRGQINPTNEQTTVTFTFHPNSVTQSAFITIILFIVGLTVLVITSLLRDGMFSGFIMVAYTFAAFLYVYHRLCFIAAVRREKQFLEALLVDTTEDEGGNQDTGTAQEPS